MGGGLPSLDGECGVEEADSLIRPRFEIAVGGNFEVFDGWIGGDFFENVLQTRRNSLGTRNGKTESVRGTRRVVRILTEDDDASFLPRTAVEGCENPTRRRKNLFFGCKFGFQKISEFAEVRFLKFFGENLTPAGFEANFWHFFWMKSSNPEIFFQCVEMAGGGRVGSAELLDFSDSVENRGVIFPAKILSDRVVAHF